LESGAAFSVSAAWRKSAFMKVMGVQQSQASLAMIGVTRMLALNEQHPLQPEFVGAYASGSASAVRLRDKTMSEPT
jgi:hypothetical protein